MPQMTNALYPQVKLYYQRKHTCRIQSRMTKDEYLAQPNFSLCNKKKAPGTSNTSSVITKQASAVKS